MPVATRRRQSITRVPPEVLALTNYSSFVWVLWEIMRGLHPTIRSGSSDHERLRAIAAWCNQTPPLSDTQLRCQICQGPAGFVNVKTVPDAHIVRDTYFCLRHCPLGESVPILLSMAYPAKGRYRTALQMVAKKAFGIKPRITEEEAMGFFDQHVFHRPEPDAWWIRND